MQQHINNGLKQQNRPSDVPLNQSERKAMKPKLNLQKQNSS
jgi:hypothetical protein